MSVPIKPISIPARLILLYKQFTNNDSYLQATIDMVIQLPNSVRLNRIMFLYCINNVRKLFSRRYFEIFSYFPENRNRHFMQIVSNRDNLQKISNHVFLEK